MEVVVFFVSLVALAAFGMSILSMRTSLGLKQKPAPVWETICIESEERRITRWLRIMGRSGWRFVLETDGLAPRQQRRLYFERRVA